MITLGVDLSIATCGLAVVQGEMLVFVQTKVTNKQVSRVERRLEILNACKVLKRAYDYTQMVFEATRLFTGGKNTPLVSIAALISLSTTLEDWAWEHSVVVDVVHTNSWRKVVLGSGRAQKSDAIAYVARKFNKTLRDDAAEAVCLAMYGQIKHGEVSR